MSTEIVRVWGKADNIDLVFHNMIGDDWAVDIPPDMTDGQYACEIHAENNYGERAMWTGILYMHMGVACLHIKQERLTLWSLPERSIPDCRSERYAELLDCTALLHQAGFRSLIHASERTAELFECRNIKRALHLLAGERITDAMYLRTVTAADKERSCCITGERTAAGIGERTMTCVDERTKIIFTGGCIHEAGRNR